MRLAILGHPAYSFNFSMSFDDKVGMTSRSVRACFFSITCCLIVVTNVNLVSMSLRSCCYSSQAIWNASSKLATFWAVPLCFSLMASSSPCTTRRLDYAWLTHSMQAGLSLPKSSRWRIVQATYLSGRYVDMLLLIPLQIKHSSKRTKYADLRPHTPQVIML